MKTLPLRFTLLKVLEERGAALEPAELYEAVKGQYPNEKQCTPSAIDEHMMSMRGVGLVDGIWKRESKATYLLDPWRQKCIEDF